MASQRCLDPSRINLEFEAFWQFFNSLWGFPCFTDMGHASINVNPPVILDLADVNDHTFTSHVDVGIIYLHFSFNLI